jgi:hypothetical protein
MACQNLAGHFPVIEMNDFAGQDLIGFVAFAGNQHGVIWSRTPGWAASMAVQSVRHPPHILCLPAPFLSCIRGKAPGDRPAEPLPQSEQ